MPLSLLLKMSPHFSEIALYDVVGAPGVAADLLHIDIGGKVQTFTDVLEALKGSNYVIIPAGVPRKPGMTREDLFSINKGIVALLADAVAGACPDAIVLVILNPVNLMVPVFANAMRKHGVFDPRRVIGVTALDSVRANTFAGEMGYKKEIAVVGGHSGETIVPLFDALGVESLGTAQWEALVARVRTGGDEVVRAKEGRGSATLSMAYAAFTTLERILAQKPVPAYLNLDSLIEGVSEAREALDSMGGALDYFALPVTFGSNGVEKVDGALLKILGAREKGLVVEALKSLKEVKV